jgi:hypothetical protein
MSHTFFYGVLVPDYSLLTLHINHRNQIVLLSSFIAIS